MTRAVETVAEKVARTRREQGLPPTLEDGPTVERIVDLLMTVDPPKRRKRRRAA